jgi:hypothetical protein
MKGFRHLNILSLLAESLIDHSHLSILLSIIDVPFESCIGCMKDLPFLIDVLPHFRNSLKLLSNEGMQSTLPLELRIDLHDSLLQYG